MYFQRSNGLLGTSPKDPFGISYVDLIFACISKLETVGLSGHDEVEFIVLLKLVIFLVENCFQELLSSQKVYDAVFQILMRYLAVEDRGTMVKINALQLMCILLYFNPQVFILTSQRFNRKDHLFFTLFGQLDLFDQYKQKDDLLLGIVGLFRLSEAQFPDVIPMSSLIREAFNCVKTICQNKTQHCSNSDGDSQETRPSEEPREEEDLGNEDEDEDDDDWNEEVYFQEELNYEYESPFQNIDPVEQLEGVLKAIEKQNPMYFKRIVNELAPAERNELNQYFSFSKHLKSNFSN